MPRTASDIDAIEIKFIFILYYYNKFHNEECTSENVNNNIMKGFLEKGFWCLPSKPSQAPIF